MTLTVIVGGTSGIGLATARRLLAAGHEVVITGRDEDRLKAALDALPIDSKVSGKTVDALDAEAGKAFFASLGSVDHLVITATGGAGAVGPVSDLTAAQVQDAVDGKLLAYVNMVQAALPVLSPTGSITGVSAISAQASAPGTTALAAANAAIDAWMRVLAVEVAPRRANVVSPGVIDTPWWNFLDEETRTATFDSYAKVTPLQRVGRPDDIAEAIEFLVGSSFTTGVVLSVDGGVRFASTG